MNSSNGAVVVVVGDKQVGKSSLIRSMVANRCCFQSAGGVVEPFVLPPEATREKAPLSIIDTSSCLQRANETEKILRLADAIVLVIAPDVAGNVNRVQAHWLPWFQTLQLHAPVILAVNVPAPEHESPSVDTLIKRSKFEACIKFHVASMEGVREVFFASHYAALNPIRPLLADTEEEPGVSPLFLKALRRIFCAISADKKVLTEAELDAFQEACFEAKGSPEVFVELKALLRASSFTFEAFLDVHTQFLKRRKPESVWKVLSTFNYDRRLLLDPACFAPPKPTPRGAELTREALDFLAAVFHSHAVTSSTSSAFLDLQGFIQIFENSPHSALYGEDLFNEIGRHVHGWQNGISLSVWLTYFVMFGLYCPHQFSTLLGYMGYWQKSPRLSLLSPRAALSQPWWFSRPHSQSIVVSVLSHNNLASIQVIKGLLGFSEVGSTSTTPLFPLASPRPVYGMQLADSFLLFSFESSPSVTADVVCFLHDESARSSSFIRKSLPSLPPRCSVVVLEKCSKSEQRIWPGTSFKVFVHPLNQSIGNLLLETGLRRKHSLVASSASAWYGVYAAATACAVVTVCAALYKANIRLVHLRS